MEEISHFWIYLLLPQGSIPQSNVCSDEFAWDSIIKSLTSLKVEASFDILAYSSVKNENHTGIVLDGIGGSFIIIIMKK